MSDSPKVGGTKVFGITFGGSKGDAKPARGAASGDGEARDNRTLIILCSTLGAVVVLGGAFLLLSGKSGSSDDAGAGAVVSPGHHVSVPSLTVPSVAAGASPSFTTGRDPFQAPAALVAALPGAGPSSAPSTGGSSAAPSAGAAPGSLSPSEIAALTAAGYNVTPISGSASASPSAGGSSSAPAIKSSNWLQVLAAHKQSDGTWRVDVRAAGGEVKSVKPGTAKVAGTALTYQGEDDELGVQTYVFTTSAGAGANVIANPKVAPYKGSLTSANRPSTLVLTGSTLVGGIF